MLQKLLRQVTIELFGRWTMNSRTLPRRRFLQAAATAASSAAVSCGGRSSPWRFFTVAEAATAGSICNRLIPKDQDPGAEETGAVNYIDRQLKGPLRKYQRAYRQGLIGVNLVSREQFGKRFEELTDAQRDEFLTMIEAGHTPAGLWNPTQAQQFFEMIRDHTMQSFYGDPRHGGNREYASWMMLGVPPSPVRGRQLYDLSGQGMASQPMRTIWRSQG